MNNLSEMSDYGNGRVVLNRYHYFGGLSEQPVMQFCTDNGIKFEFIHILWEAFQSNSAPDTQKLMQFETSMILEYLEKTHAYYLDKLIPEIEINIFRFAQLLGIDHPIIVHIINCFDVYKQDLVVHIQEGEMLCFTYTKQLLNKGVKTTNYKIDHFINEHEHKEDHLGELLCYLKNHVSQSDEMSFKMVTAKLELLRRDLIIHALVEDEVLVPKIRQLENQ